MKCKTVDLFQCRWKFWRGQQNDLSCWLMKFRKHVYRAHWTARSQTHCSKATAYFQLAMGWKQYRDLDLLQAEIWKFKQEFSSALWHGSQWLGWKGRQGLIRAPYSGPTVAHLTRCVQPQAVPLHTTWAALLQACVDGCPFPNSCCWSRIDCSQTINHFVSSNLWGHRKTRPLGEIVELCCSQLHKNTSSHQHLDFHCRLFDCFKHWSLLEIRKNT